MKKTALLLTAAACAFSIVGLFACDNTPEPEPEPTPEGPTHECSFVLENAEEKYLATAATCVEGATYYKSCECGEKGTETFALTLLGNHVFGDDDVCTVCGNHKATEGLEYAITDDHAYVKSVNGVTGEVIYIDSVFNGCPVTGIIKTAFKDCKTLKKVVIPNGITSIGENAFSGSALAEITLPESVTSIDKTAFEGCAIKTAMIPAETCVYVNNSELKAVIITSGTVISDDAFTGCTNLGVITVSDSVEKLFASAFDGCSSLAYTKDGNACYLGNETNNYLWLVKAKDTSITECVVNKDCKHICSDAFDGCTVLESITVAGENTVYASQDGILYNKDKTEIVFVTFAINGEITIPATITSIGAEAFKNRAGLTKITLNKGIGSIGANAFSGCALTEIALPDSVTSIDENAFDGCTALESVTVAGENTAYASQDGILYNKDKTEIVFVPLGIKGEITIPDTITSIGAEVFKNRTGLTKINIPESVTSIDKTAFDGCANSIYKEEGNVYYLGNETNRYLWLIKAKSTAITECTINKDCKHICEGAFDGCTELTVINYNAINCADMIGGVFATSDKNGKDVTIKIGKDVKRIPSYMFYFAQTATKVEFEGGSALESIGDYAFFNCIKITSIDIPASVNSIGKYAFYHCTALKTINFGGTKEQWNAIVKGENCTGYMSGYKIVCTDGEVE